MSLESSLCFWACLTAQFRRLHLLDVQWVQMGHFAFDVKSMHLNDDTCFVFHDSQLLILPLSNSQQVCSLFVIELKEAATPHSHFSFACTPKRPIFYPLGMKVEGELAETIGSLSSHENASNYWNDEFAVRTESQKVSKTFAIEYFTALGLGCRALLPALDSVLAVISIQGCEIW